MSTGDSEGVNIFLFNLKNGNGELLIITQPYVIVIVFSRTRYHFILIITYSYLYCNN